MHRLPSSHSAQWTMGQSQLTTQEVQLKITIIKIWISLYSLFLPNGFVRRGRNWAGLDLRLSQSFRWGGRETRLMCWSILPFCFYLDFYPPNKPIRGKQTVVDFFLIFNDFNFYWTSCIVNFFPEISQTQKFNWLQIINLTSLYVCFFAEEPQVA